MISRSSKTSSTSGRSSDSSCSGSSSSDSSGSTESRVNESECAQDTAAPKQSRFEPCPSPSDRLAGPAGPESSAMEEGTAARTVLDSIASLPMASCPRGKGVSRVVNSAVPVDQELPADKQCVLDSVNKSLELMGRGERLTLEILAVAQDKLIADNPRAQPEAYGCSKEGNRSFKIAVVAEALRKLLPGYNITLRNLCKVQGLSKAIQRVVTSGGKGHFLVDGELDKAWYPDEDPRGEWRHMVLVARNWMHEYSAGSWSRYPVCDTTKRGSVLPSLFDKANQPRYFNHIHRIHEFWISAKVSRP